ncbi:MAG: acyl-CoA dehydratase activase [bacterium]
MNQAVRRRPEATGKNNAAPRLFSGVDVGAAATKLVLMAETGERVAEVALPSGVDYEATAKSCLEQALSQAGAIAEQIVRTVATGYGRRNVSFADETFTEIHCHGVGAHFLVGGRAFCLVDIGGQDNKIIHLRADGTRDDFKMNRKCAAGTGAFIEEIALRLGLELSTMDGLARSSQEAVKLSSFCTVFAKTEILAHLRQGVPVAQIVRGAFLSVINRVLEMDPLAEDVVLTGGVVHHNGAIADILAEKLGRPVTVPPSPQFTGALGAALLARQQMNRT